jgi:hypothetical protein
MMPNLHIKFHQNPLNSLGEVVLTRYMNGQTDRKADGHGDSYIPSNCVCGGYKYKYTYK